MYLLGLWKRLMNIKSRFILSINQKWKFCDVLQWLTPFKSLDHLFLLLCVYNLTLPRSDETAKGSFMIIVFIHLFCNANNEEVRGWKTRSKITKRLETTLTIRVVVILALLCVIDNWGSVSLYVPLFLFSLPLSFIIFIHLPPFFLIML